VTLGTVAWATAPVTPSGVETRSRPGDDRLDHQVPGLLRRQGGEGLVQLVGAIIGVRTRGMWMVVKVMFWPRTPAPRSG
jgi:hypothetical protein